MSKEWGSNRCLLSRPFGLTPKGRDHLGSPPAGGAKFYFRLQMSPQYQWWHKEEGEGQEYSGWFFKTTVASVCRRDHSCSQMSPRHSQEHKKEGGKLKQYKKDHARLAKEIIVARIYSVKYERSSVFCRINLI